MSRALAVLPGFRPTAKRRQLLAAASAGWLLLATAPARAVSSSSLADVVRHWAGGRPVGQGRITLEIAPLVENGNAVPITVRLDSPMTPTDRVLEIIVFNEKNPQRDVVRFNFGPAAGRAEASTRIRLATSQQLVALARMADGSQWQHTVDVVVTLAACIEG